MGVRVFWRDIGETGGNARRTGIALAGDAGRRRLRYLDGGGVGCFNEDERPTDRRRLYHHLTFYGFLLCFASTSVATLYHYLLAREAPYPWYDLPVVLGTVGGIGLIIGPLGLFRQVEARSECCRTEAARHGRRVHRDAVSREPDGLLLLVLRATPAMGPCLRFTSASSSAFFITMPYGKFVHGIYRFVALVRYAKERRAMTVG